MWMNALQKHWLWIRHKVSERRLRRSCDTAFCQPDKEQGMSAQKSKMCSRNVLINWLVLESFSSLK